MLNIIRRSKYDYSTLFNQNIFTESRNFCAIYFQIFNLKHKLEFIASLNSIAQCTTSIIISVDNTLIALYIAALIASLTTTSSISFITTSFTLFTTVALTDSVIKSKISTIILLKKIKDKRKMIFNEENNDYDSKKDSE